MSEAIKRRGFIKQISLGMLGAGFALDSMAVTHEIYKNLRHTNIRVNHKPNVALIKGGNRKTNMYDALKLIEDDIRSRIGNKQIVIKPNFTRVAKKEWLASTHVDNIRALLEFLQPFYKRKVIIAEGTGGADPIEIPLKNFDYYSLQKDYDVEFFDLRKDRYVPVYLTDSSIQPVPIQTSGLLTNPDIFLISAAVMKTHNLAVVTLGLKNIVLAAPMNTGTGLNDRGKLHKDPVSKDPRYFNYNMFLMAQHAFPDLVLIDGFVGMQGKGPLFGDPIEVGVAIASTDCIAADRVGTEVMGHDFNDVGHLVHCANAKMGEGDITKINVLGDRIAGCRKNFRKTDDWEAIRHWN